MNPRQFFLHVDHVVNMVRVGPGTDPNNEKVVITSGVISSYGAEAGIWEALNTEQRMSGLRVLFLTFFVFLNERCRRPVQWP